VVKTPGAEGVGIAMAPYSYLQQLKFSLEDQRPTKRINFDANSRTFHYDDSDLWNYQPPTHYVIDGVKIEAGGRGVILGGSDNVLRNSVIEVDSATAVYVYGPNAVVEGNTFIVHRKVGGDENTSAPLKMRDADGAVIRNNRFIVTGLLTGTADVAINLLESRGVVIENNHAEGVKEWLRKDDASSATSRGNVFK
jgi:Right handed beta helix region